MPYLVSISERGITFTVHGGKLRAGPRSRITPEVRAWILTRREALLAQFAESRQCAKSSWRKWELPPPLTPAEAADAETARVWRYRLSDKPGVWLTMVSTNSETTAEARARLDNTYGSERVLALAPG